MTEVRGYRDVAVAALLDLLDALGLDTVPELGPVGTFVPAVEHLAAIAPSCSSSTASTSRVRRRDGS